MKKKKEQLKGGKNNLMKGRVTHSVMKRPLHSFFKLSPFSHAAPRTHAQNPTQRRSALYLSLRARNEWSDRHRESMDPLPREGNALTRTDLKTTSSPPFCLLAFYSPLSILPLLLPSISFRPDSQPLSGLSPSLLTFHDPGLFSLAIPYSSSVFFLFVCLIILRLFVVCSCSL